MRPITGCAVAILFAAGCAHRGGTTAADRNGDANGGAPPSEVRRRDQYRDREREQLGIGSIVVAVRSIDRPAEAFDNFRVSLVRENGQPIRTIDAGARASVEFDSLPAGIHHIQAVRIGYNVLRIPVPVDAGCRTQVEGYLSTQSIGLTALIIPSAAERAAGKKVEEAPRSAGTPPRSTITRCGATP